MSYSIMAIRKWVLDHKFFSAFLALASIHFGIYSLQKLAKVKKSPDLLPEDVADDAKKAPEKS